MILQKLKNENVKLMAPLQSHGKFAKPDPNFWKRAKNGYTIYLLAANQLFEDREKGDTLFYVWTGATYCVFRGFYNP